LSSCRGSDALGTTSLLCVFLPRWIILVRCRLMRWWSWPPSAFATNGCALQEAARIFSSDGQRFRPGSTKSGKPRPRQAPARLARSLECRPCPLGRPGHVGTVEYLIGRVAGPPRANVDHGGVQLVSRRRIGGVLQPRDRKRRATYSGYSTSARKLARVAPVDAEEVDSSIGSAPLGM